MVQTNYIFFANILINALLLIWVLYIYIKIRHTSKMGSLLIANRLFYLVGGVLIILRPILPIWLHMLIPNILLILSSFFFVLYLSYLTHKRYYIIYQLILITIYGLLSYLYIYCQPSFQNRSILISIIVIAQTLPLLLANIKASYINKSHYLAIYRIYTFYFITHIIRLSYYIYNSVLNDLFLGTVVSTTIMLLQFFVELALILTTTSILLFFYNRERHVRR